MKIMYSELTGCYYAVEGRKKTNVTAEVEAAQNKMCDSCIHKVSKEDIDALIQQGRAEATNEIMQIIHNIYTQDLYCKADLCQKDEKGYDCEDCLFNAINQNLEHIKEGKNG